MAQSSSAVIGILLVVILAGLIGVIFVGDVLGSVEEDTNNMVVIDSKEEMMKLIIYDSMIAYGCEDGGHLDNDGDKYWGDWSTMKKYVQEPDTISFDELNSSMPKVYEGLPCYGTGSTLPGTGGAATNIPGSPLSKEWRDDQEGIQSRIEFKINDSDLPGATDITIPKCFVHHTASNPKKVGVSAFNDQYETRPDDAVTNSWFLMSKQDQNSVFNRGSGWKELGLDCTSINPGSPSPITPRYISSVTQKEKWSHGPTMNVEVLDDSVGTDFSTGSGMTVSNGGWYSDIDIHDFEVTKGTTGYIQTNVGCTSQSPPHTLSDTPGISGKEIKSDLCDNKLHPFIVITKEG